jgi:hypothetical protein
VAHSRRRLLGSSCVMRRRKADCAERDQRNELERCERADDEGRDAPGKR